MKIRNGTQSSRMRHSGIDVVGRFLTHFDVVRAQQLERRSVAVHRSRRRHRGAVLELAVDRRRHVGADLHRATPLLLDLLHEFRVRNIRRRRGARIETLEYDRSARPRSPRAEILGHIVHVRHVLVRIHSARLCSA